VIRSVDIVVINEAEIRELTGEFNLVKAARKLMRMGPGRVVIKRGNTASSTCPTGRSSRHRRTRWRRSSTPPGGGQLRGGFMGYLASRDGAALTEMDYRLATIYGSAIASFTVEAFSTERLQGLSREEIDARLSSFRALTNSGSEPGKDGGRPTMATLTKAARMAWEIGAAEAARLRHPFIEREHL